MLWGIAKGVIPIKTWPNCKRSLKQRGRVNNKNRRMQKETRNGREGIKCENKAIGWVFETRSRIVDFWLCMFLYKLGIDW